jgi:hypothetical protein
MFPLHLFLELDISFALKVFLDLFTSVEDDACRFCVVRSELGEVLKHGTWVIVFSALDLA